MQQHPLDLLALVRLGLPDAGDRAREIAHRAGPRRRAGVALGLSPEALVLIVRAVCANMQSMQDIS